MEIAIVVSNFIYAILGALLTILLMVLGYKILDWITPFDTSKQLGEGNDMFWDCGHTKKQYIL